VRYVRIGMLRPWTINDATGGPGRAHELARYEALFAARTRGMKSSAMREMMALTERPT
jgi:hypothetical protein